MTIGGIVERERRPVRRVELLAGVLLGGGTCALVLALAAALFARSRWIALPRPAPVVVWLIIGAGLVTLIVRTRRRLSRDASPAGVARAIEREQGLRRGMLLGAIELEGSGALAGRAALAAQASLPPQRVLAPRLRRTTARRGLIAAAVAAAGLLLLATASPLFGDGLLAVLRPIDAWRGSLLEPLVIDGAPRELVRGSPLQVRVRGYKGRTRIFLDVRQTGEPWRVDTLVAERRGDAPSWTLRALRGDVRLVASDGRSSSDAVVVHAVDRPFLGAIALHAVYPTYLGRTAESLPVGEPLRLPRGTALEISGRASVPLSAVTLGDGRQTFALAPTGQAFAGRFAPTQSMRLEWGARSPSGVQPDLPPPLEIELVADSAPQVAITAPAADTILVSDTGPTLALVASDDHGLASVALRITRGAEGTTTRQVVTTAPGVGASWVGQATLDVAALRLRAGESARVRAEATDASPWAQTGVSRELVVRRATAEELRASARALADSAVQQATTAAMAQRSLAQRTDEAARAQARQGRGAGQSGGAAVPRGQQSSMTYDNAEKARALAQEQRAMTDRVQKLRDATKHLEQQLKAAGALDSSLARQLADAQALLRQALTPQLLAQMQKLDNAASQLSSEQSRDALRDLAQMQQRLREQLERSAEMLKRAAHEGAMQTLGDQAAELAARQKAFADSASRPAGDRAGREPREAAHLADQSARLRDEMAALQERLMKDRAAAGASRTDRAKQHAGTSETAMRRAAESNGADRARGAAGEMEDAAKAMRDARAAQVQEWKRELTTELDQAVQEMMQLAREERALEQKARSGAPADDRRSAQSAVEQGMEKASERLQQAGRKSALFGPRSQRAVGDAKDKVTQATQSVSQPQGSASQEANALGEAADALTRAAAALARDRERTNTAQSASGFTEMLEQMRNAAQRQGQINAQAQALFGMPNSAGNSGAGQALGRKLAREQRGVAEQLDEAGDAAGGDRAAQLAREARQLADALEGGRLDAATLARQQQLFRRLLDAGRSLEKEERDDAGKREAKSAVPGETFTPGAKVDARAAVRFRPPTWDELRGLTAGERRAILDYFTRLNSAPAP